MHFLLCFMDKLADLPLHDAPYIRCEILHPVVEFAARAVCPWCQAEMLAAAAELAMLTAEVTRLREELAAAADKAGATEAELTRLGREAADVELKLAAEVLQACWL